MDIKSPEVNMNFALLINFYFVSIVIWIIAGLFVLYLLIAAYNRYRRVKNFKPEDESNKLIKLQDRSFKKQISSGLFLVDFWAPWCGPCKVIAPIISELADQFEGKASVGKLNVDENVATASEYGVRSIPTLILFRNGVPVKHFVGVKSKSVFVKAIESQLS